MIKITGCSPRGDSAAALPCRLHDPEIDRICQSI